MIKMINTVFNASFVHSPCFLGHRNIRLKCLKFSAPIVGCVEAKLSLRFPESVINKINPCHKTSSPKIVIRPEDLVKKHNGNGFINSQGHPMAELMGEGEGGQWHPIVVTVIIATHAL